MLKAVTKFLPESFHRRTLYLFVLFAAVSSITTVLVLNYYDRQTFREYARETILNIHSSVEDRIKDSILFDDIFTLYSVSENITESVSIVSNIIIFGADDEYITDALVTKEVDELSAGNSEKYDIVLKNGKHIGKVIYVIDTSHIDRVLLEHSLYSIIFIAPFVAVFIFFSITLIRFLTRPLKSISKRLKNADISELPIEFDLPEHTSVELKKLAESFTSLSTELDESIRAQLESEKALAKEERLAAIGSMSAGLAHELRNPAMSLQLLMHSIKEADNQILASDIEVMEMEISRIASTVNEFLKVSKQINIDVVEVKTSELKSVLKDYADRVMRGGVNLNFKGEDIIFRSDPLLLYNIFENLISNSYEAGATECSIVFIHSGENIDIVFTDNGSGIDESSLEKIFHPFYTTKSSGVGLGMSMCEKMVTALGGKITVDADVAQGAKFDITIKDIQ